MNESVRIVLAHGDELTRDDVGEMLRSIGHVVDLVTDSGREMIEAVRKNPPELLISGVRLTDMDGIEALITCGEEEPIPSVIVSEETDQEKVERALQDHVMAYLSQPVDISDLRPAIFLVMERFAQFRELRSENATLKEALAIRKWVERAKGLLMALHDLNENDAYRRLQRTASDRRQKIGDVARQLIEQESSEK